ncbi:hypothetical protein BD560DRAFT_355912 [Blakeslea trispora]|nr:hypothetical protein BD560DRAFT_355912 [Blakeslea trispora]
MSIYNTSRTIKGRNTNSRPPVNRLARPPPPPQRVFQQQQQQQPDASSYNEFSLFSTAQRSKNHVMDFKTNKRVEPKEFARPIKLHRKETNFVPYRQYIQNLNAQNAAAAAAAAAQQAQTAAQAPTEDLTLDNPTPSQPQQQQQQHGPRTGADISLIAPMGGATHNKKMLFKKRTKQIYMAKEDTRELKEQEHLPWILEDYDGQNSFTGTYEGGQRSDYVLFVLSDNGFQVMPVERWYKFQPKRNVKTLSLEEAEEQIKKQQKRENNRWMMLKRERDVEETPEERPQRRLKLVDHEEKKAQSDDENRQDSDMDDLDFDDVFQDDEEDQGEHEVEDEDVKDSKDRVKKEIKDFAITGREDTEAMDEEMKLTSEGKQMRKLVRDLEKNRAYESDEEEADPYASSAEEELESDHDEESQSEAEKEKKPTPIPPKKKASLLHKPKKPMQQKIKKEGLSKPMGRPGSPSIYLKKETPKPSPSDAAPTSVPPPAAKKRREEPVPVVEKRKEEEDLITEKEVIETLRGKTMTTKEFLYNFRKRIRRNNRNREIITQLLKKVARSSKGSTDPNTRMLELKPEFQQ